MEEEEKKLISSIATPANLALLHEEHKAILEGVSGLLGVNSSRICSLLRLNRRKKKEAALFSFLQDPFHFLPSETCVSSELETLLVRLHKELADFLAIEDLSTPQNNLRILYDKRGDISYFDEQSKFAPAIRISHSDMNKYCLPTAIAHELFHFLTKYLGIRKDLQKGGIEEGFARGIELAIAERDAEKHHDPRYTICTKSLLYSDICAFYALMENKPIDHTGSWVWQSAAFVIADKKQGKGIYRDLVHTIKPYDRLLEMLS